MPGPHDADEGSDPPDAASLMRAAPRAVDELDAQRAFSAVANRLLGPSTEEALVGRFQLRERVGSGGMGVVYAAFDPQLGRRVAIKLLHPSSATERGHSRLIREARNLARLNHPNIVGVYEIGTVDDRVFIAMELVEGVALSEWLREEHPWPEVVRVLHEAGNGVRAAHSAGIVHRDFKPANVMIGEEGRVIVLDFGLARAPQLSKSEETATAQTPDPDQSATQQGAVVGTPAYMAPEQHHGREATEASDQFAFCVSMYEALYGQRPFTTTSRVQLLDAIERGRLEPVRKSNSVPRWLRKIILRGLSPDPSDRWPSMSALLAAIQRRLRTRWRRALVPGLAFMAGAAALVAWPRDEVSCDDEGAAIELQWNPAVAVSTSSSLSAIDHPNAQTVSATVERALNAYVDRWSVMRVDACQLLEAQPNDESAQNAVACLEGQQRWLESTLKLLAAPDLQVLLDAPNLVPRVPDLDSCALDVVSEAALASAASARDRATLERLRGEALALGRAGRHEAAMELANTARGLAEASNDEGLRARSYRLTGMLHRWAGDRQQAAEMFEAAVVRAERAGDVVARLDAMRSLAEELISTGRMDEAERMLRRVEAAHERFDVRPWKWDAELHLLHTYLSIERVEYDDAVFHAQQYVEAVELNAEEDPGQNLVAKTLLAKAMANRGDTKGMLERWNAIREEGVELYGPIHATQAAVLSSMAVLAFRGRERQQAVDLALASLRIRELLRGNEHPSLIKVLLNLAGFWGLANPAESLRSARRAATIARKHRPTYDRQLSKALHNAALVMGSLDEERGAVEALRESYEINVKLLGPKHPSTLSTLQTIGTLLISLGEMDEARELFERAYRLESAERGEDNPRLISSLVGLAKIVDIGGDSPGGLVHARKALELARAHDTAAGPGIQARITFALIRMVDTDAAATDEADVAITEAEALAEHNPVHEMTRAHLAGLRAKITARQARARE